MYASGSSKKILTAAVLCSLLAASPVWASDQTATATVTTGNTAATRYTSINVTQDTTTNPNETDAILHKGTTAMTVYMAAGGTITATTSGITSTRVSTAGIANDSSSSALTVDDALALTAKTETPENAYQVMAVGTQNYGTLNLGALNATNTVSVSATGASYTKAAGLGQLTYAPGAATTTVDGTTELTVSAATGTSAAADATAVGLGFNMNMLGYVPNIGTGAFKLDDVSGSITATGGTMDTASGSAMATAYGTNLMYYGSLTAKSLDLDVMAQGGTAAAADGSVTANAYGLWENISSPFKIAANNGTVTVTGATNLQVSAQGGSSTGAGTSKDAAASAVGIGYKTSNLSGSTVACTGTYKLQDVTAVVTATGGTANAASGSAAADACGVSLQGSGSLTAQSLDLTVAAQGGTASGSATEAGATAYGIKENFYLDTAATGTTGTVNVSGATRLNVTAAGGTAAAAVRPHDAYSVFAYGIVNDMDSEVGSKDPSTITMNLGPVSGTVTATGGTSTADYNFYLASVKATGIENYGSMNLDSVDLTVNANGGTIAAGLGEVNAKAQGLMAHGLSANGVDSTLTVNGATNLKVAAAGGQYTGTGTIKLNSASAYGASTESYYPGVGTVALVTEKLNATVSAAAGNVNANDFKISANAYGLEEGTNGITTAGLNLDVTATGGNASGTTNGTANTGYSSIYAVGINSYWAPLQVKDTANLKVQAAAGEATAGAAFNDSYVRAYGLNLYVSSATLQDLTGTVSATASSSTAATADTRAYGVYLSDTTATVKDVNLTVTATGGKATTAAKTYADGFYLTNGSKLQVTGDAIVKTALTMAESPGSLSWGQNGGNVVSLRGQSVLNLGTDGQNSLGKLVQLEGDVWSNSESKANITLDQSASYLQGNVFANGGTVNLVVADGATWRPVYDNRYGSFDTDTAAGYETHAPDYTVTANSIDTLTLKDGGIVDLTWDNPTRSSEFRTLSVGTLTGDNGVFKINSDLANNKADSISVGAGSTSTQAYIDVAYDPYLSSETLTAGKSMTGKARVVTASPTSMTFAGKQDSYNLYTYTPTLVNNGDGTWDLTALTIDSAKTSGHVKTAGVDRLGLNSLFQFETNSLSRRLGELRDADTTSGIWARYYDGKLEQGDAILKAHLFQAGYDKRSDGKNEKTYRGAALSYAKGDGTYALGSGDMKETTFSLYQTGIKNDGRYYDVVLKVGKYMNDYDVTATANPSSADYSTWAYSISGEMGKRIQLGKGLYVEPQAELILGRLNGADYTTSTGMQVSVDAQNKAITRLGLAFGKSYTRGSLYGKFSYYHDFGTGVDLNAADGGNSVGYSEDMARNWTELTIGGSAKLGKNANAYAEVSKYMGQLTSNVRYNIGARWSF